MPTLHKESLRFVRLMMVISGMTPLFLLWAIRGMEPASGGCRDTVVSLVDLRGFGGGTRAGVIG